MTAEFRHSVCAVRGYRLYSLLASALMVLVGLCSSLEWWLGFNLVPDLGGCDMRLTAALCILLSGLALAAVGRGGTGVRLAASLLCVAMIVLGADALLEHGVAEHRGVADRLDAALGAGVRPPVLMAELAAGAFVLLGGQGILVLNSRAVALREVFGLGVLTIAMASVASLAFLLTQRGGSLLDHLPPLTGISLLFGALGWMSSTPTTGLTRITTAASVGGLFARSLLLPLAYTFAFKLLETRFGVPQIIASTLGAVFTGGSVAWMIWLVAALLDRSERLREASLQLRNVADTDSLTGLGNRRKFDAEIDALLREYHQQQTPFSLLVLDVDHFKAYNDSFGHQAGDEALREIGRVLRTVLRPRDVAVRYGGEEFVLLVHGVRMQQLSVVAARILHAVRANDWPLQPLSASIGGAEVCGADSAATLLQRADASLYRAKRNGRDRFEAMGCAECFASRSAPPALRAREWDQPPPGCSGGQAA